MVTHLTRSAFLGVMLAILGQPVTVAAQGPVQASKPGDLSSTHKLSDLFAIAFERCSADSNDECVTRERLQTSFMSLTDLSMLMQSDPEISSSLVISGTATYRGRMLPAAIYQYFLTLSDRRKGITETFCAMGRGIEDNQFEMLRAVSVGSCEGAENDNSIWSAQIGFDSKINQFTSFQSAVQNTKPVAMTAKINGGLQVSLTKSVDSAGGYCKLFFNLQNDTEVNITSLDLDFVLKEKDGSILTKNNVMFKRVKPGNNIDEDALVKIDRCNQIAEVKMSVFQVKVDGSFVNSKDAEFLFNNWRLRSQIEGLRLTD